MFLEVQITRNPENSIIALTADGLTEYIEAALQIEDL